MIKQKPGVMIYHSVLPQLELLSKDACGRLFRALVSYSATGRYDPLPRDAEVIMRGYVPIIDRDTQRYALRCRRLRLAALKRWHADVPEDLVREDDVPEEDIPEDDVPEDDVPEDGAEEQPTA